MTMRCYVPPAAWTGETIVLRDEEAHHLGRVLRAKEGQPVLVIDGRGREAEAEVTEARRNEIALRVLQVRAFPRPPVELTLIQALPREQKMDLVIQKATELGVAAIVPVLTEHALVKIEGHAERRKQDRWDRIAINAAKQCGSLWVPVVHPVVPLLDYLAAMPRFDLLLVASLEGDAQPLREILQAARARDPKSIAFLIGPEGDLNMKELAAARQAGARAASLGHLVLRTETAALYALSALKYEFS